MIVRLTLCLALLAGSAALTAVAAETDVRTDVRTDASPGDVSFDWNNVPIAVVVQAILGDIHGAAYEIAPGVDGTVTYTTPRPVSRWEALALLEQQLAMHGALLVDTGRGYLIQPAADAD